MSITETVKLSAPLKTHEGEVNALTLKEPKARAFMEHGEPFKSRVVTGRDGEKSIEFDYDYKVFAKFLVEMIVERVDDLVLGSLSTSDFYALRTKATHFILGLVGDENPSQPSVA